MHFACLVKFRGGTAERVWNFILSHQNVSYPTHLLESWWRTWWHKNSRGIKFESSKQTEQRRHYGDHLKMCFLSNTSISISSYPSSHRLDFVRFFIEMDLEVIQGKSKCSFSFGLFHPGSDQHSTLPKPHQLAFDRPCQRGSSFPKASQKFWKTIVQSQRHHICKTATIYA